MFSIEIVSDKKPQSATYDFINEINDFKSSSQWNNILIVRANIAWFLLLRSLGLPFLVVFLLLFHLEFIVIIRFNKKVRIAITFIASCNSQREAYAYMAAEKKPFQKTHTRMQPQKRDDCLVIEVQSISF